MVVEARTSIIELLNRVQKLSDTGRDAAVVAELGAVPVQELEQSPTLALLFGISQGRLGRHNSGKQWVAMALETALARGDRSIEARALNVSGAIAFEEGRIDEALDYFRRGLAEAERQGDRATVGRCSNNLGIIFNMRGQYDEAVGSYTMAQAAFLQVGHHTGAAKALHNLAITYRDQRALGPALETEERAALEAAAGGDLGLIGQIHCGRGEIRLRAGDAEVARIEVQRALTLHREIGDSLREADDLRVLAGTLEVLRQPIQAESLLRDVIARRNRLNRPLVTAEAERDLARLLHRQKRNDEAAELAVQARERFAALGAVVEARRLDRLLSEMAS
ncbi:MAG: tetratricopeptide repeat protein [Gemmatimonadetes bacterium]|nr:tetratricopeptide repeat protein [Gemmatimonadota bacterium]